MNIRTNKLLLLIFFSLLIMLFAAVSCEPMARFQIRNDTNQTLDIFIAFTYLDHVSTDDPRVSEGVVLPGQILKAENVHASTFTYLIEAKDASGKVVYSKEFSSDELRKMDWKVVITSSQ